MTHSRNNFPCFIMHCNYRLQISIFREIMHGSVTAREIYRIKFFSRNLRKARGIFKNFSKFLIIPIFFGNPIHQHRSQTFWINRNFAATNTRDRHFNIFLLCQMIQMRNFRKPKPRRCAIFITRITRDNL